MLVLSFYRLAPIYSINEACYYKNMSPRYSSLSKEEWCNKIDSGVSLLEPCRVCPWECGVDRTNSAATSGRCGMNEKPVVFSVSAHFGEEKCLVGNSGSGTIFFTSCNLSCVYCQNFDISQLRKGQTVTIQELAQQMIYLQQRGCHNINFVSPSIWVPQILESLQIAVEQGLDIPIVYNTGGYDRVDTLRILDGIVDIYMPDVKYSSNESGRKYSGPPDYWDVVRNAVKEMHRQVGDLVITNDGIAERGLLVRHLVLPNNIAGTEAVMRFLANEISKNSYVNVMDQYRPVYNVADYSELSRCITEEEFEQAVEMAHQAGLSRFDHLV